MHEKSKEYPTLALFDFDGTLCKIDSFTGFIFFALPKWQIMIRGIVILPWIVAYYLKLYPAHSMRPKLFKQMFQGQNQNTIQAAAFTYAEKLVTQYLNPELYTRLRQHQSLSHRVILVSASVNLYLAPLCKLLNIELICTEIDDVGPKITGLYSSLDCSHQQKKIRILKAINIEKYEHIYAYGNSHEDAEMLSLAQSSYFIGRDHKLPDLH